MGIHVDCRTPLGILGLKIYLFIFLAVLGLRCCTSFSLAAEIRGCSLVAMLGLLTVEASLVEHGL